jgi:hypothetical protein
VSAVPSIKPPKMPIKKQGNVVRVGLPSVRHDREGFERLVHLYEETKGLFFEEIEIDFNATSWFDADMCAPLGAILYKLGRELNTVRVVNVQHQVQKILCKNGFLTSYGGEKVHDNWGTTIPYQRFDSKDDRFFASYIEKEFIKRKELPPMTKALRKKFRESVFEIFSNAVIHSETKEGIFSCGQFFPMKGKMDFCVTDLGVGIRRNVNEKAGLSLSAEEAIDWAIRDGNTTKSGSIPGGLGLKLLREFVTLNKGKIQIVSDAGYWCLDKGTIMAGPLSSSFPGTIVCIEVNTRDRSSYALTSEISPDEIF